MQTIILLLLFLVENESIDDSDTRGIVGPRRLGGLSRSGVDVESPSFLLRTVCVELSN